MKYNYFCPRDVLLERTETSAEKPGGFTVRQESKMIGMEITETEEIEEEAFALFKFKISLKILLFHV